MADSGLHITEYNDFVLGTSSAYVSDSKRLINDAVKNTYFWGRFIDGSLGHHSVTGGVDIKEKLILRHGGVTKNVKTGAFNSWQNPQVSIQAKADWRKTLTHKSWADDEIYNNERVKYGNRAARFMQYTDIDNQKDAVMQTDLWEYLDLAMFALPNAAEMEVANGLDQFSLFSMVNEFASTNGLFQRAPGGNWTTKETIDPTTTDNAKWDHQRASYDSSALDNSGNVFGAFDEMMHLTHFERPATHKQYWEDPAMRKRVILSSKYGRKVVMHLLRNSQDHFVAGPQDPAYQDPQFQGIQIAWADPLDTAAVYPSTIGTDLSPELDTAQPNTGPRYYFWDANYMKPVINEERFFHKYAPTRHHNVVDTWVQACMIDWNLFTTSLMRQGLVSPSGDPYSIGG